MIYFLMLDKLHGMIKGGWWIGKLVLLREFLKHWRCSTLFMGNIFTSGVISAGMFFGRELEETYENLHRNSISLQTLFCLGEYYYSIHDGFMIKYKPKSRSSLLRNGWNICWNPRYRFSYCFFCIYRNLMGINTGQTIQK